jgi:hypothetical protein
LVVTARLAVPAHSTDRTPGFDKNGPNFLAIRAALADRGGGAELRLAAMSRTAVVVSAPSPERVEMMKRGATESAAREATSGKIE